MKSGAKSKRVSRITVSQIEGYPDVPRGHALVGARAIAQCVWNDPEKARAAYSLHRSTFGLMMLAGKLTGYSNWIDQALARQAGRLG
jgi:hypothetical protein